MTSMTDAQSVPTPESTVNPQREALADVLKRSEERERGEVQLQAEDAERRRVAEVKRLRTSRGLTQRRERYEGHARAEHERRSREGASQLASTRERLAAEHAAARDRLAEEFDKTNTEARKELEHAIWVAESVYDAKKAKAAHELQEAEARSKAYAESLTAIEDRAKALLKRYGMARWSSVSYGEFAFTGDPGAEQVLIRQHKRAEDKLAELGRLQLPQWTAGLQLWVIGFLLLVAAGAGLLGAGEWRPTQWLWIGLPVAGIIIATGLWGLWKVAHRRVRDIYLPLAEAAAWARAAADRWVVDLAMANKEQDAERRRKRDHVIHTAKTHFTPILQDIATRRTQRWTEIEAHHARQMDEAQRERDARQASIDAALDKRLAALTQRYDRLQALTRARFEGRISDSAARAAADRQRLDAAWTKAWTRLEQLTAEDNQRMARLCPGWDDPRWGNWMPPTEHPPGVRFGSLDVDARRFQPTSRPRSEGRGHAADARLTLPAMMRLAEKGSVLWRYGEDGRFDAVRSVQAVMARLLTSLPPGRARLTIIDPVALGQNFAGFMHLVDYEEDLVGKRIWTASDQIESRLADLTEHMENVIQKYLRNEFDTIEAYNAVAGELAEPYRFLVITDFPTNFSETAAQRLRSILRSGPRCGVYTLIAVDERQKLPGGIELRDLETHSITLSWNKGAQAFAWQDPVFGQFPLELDAPPDEEALTRLMHRVGQGAKDSLRVEVPFAQIAPREEERWSRDSRRDLRVPIGRTGATRRQEIVLGRDVAQHVLISGKTGSGKSTLLHVMVTNLALWYAPDEVEFYLIDFKKGVEFKTYATHRLPHARAVAIESDREFGLSVLQRLDAEITRRGEIFRRAGVQNITDYRDASSGVRMPRTLLIIDEFQEFFSSDDKLAQDANVLIDRLVRQGRAFGIHVLLGSQTLAGSGLGRATMGQMAVRIALQCSEADAQLILADDNTAARLLNRPGEAIYNDAGGLVEGNSPFQVSWLSDEERDGALRQVGERYEAVTATREIIVFEGNAPANLAGNRLLRDALDNPPAKAPIPLRVPLGEAIAIKDATTLELRRHGGGNVVFIGQQDDTAAALTAASLLTLAAHHPPGSVRLLVLDATPPDSSHTHLLPRIVSGLPHEARIVEYRDVQQTLSDLAALVQHRIDSNELDARATFLFIHGLQRYRMLRRQEDDFSFSTSSDDENGPTKKPRPDKDFVTILREGPPVGIHVFAWADSLSTLERTLERQTIREFDNRVLMQMSAADSSTLIDSPAASQLGYHRALFANEERGILEKFRPYGVPGATLLDEVLTRLAARLPAGSLPVTESGHA